MIPFIPRKVARKAAKPTTPSRTTDEATKTVQTAGPSKHILSAQNASASGNTLTPTLKGKERQIDAPPNEVYSDLLQLSLSDHALYLDATLRRMMESSREGYIPLTHLLRHSPYLSSLSPPPTEASVIKSVRAHSPDVFDVRVLFSEPSRALWFGNSSTTRDDSGGYEIRLKDWDDALKRARNTIRAEWESRTVYMENIPLHYRSIPGIYRFTSKMLGHSPSPQCVQSVSLPPHHRDKPDTQPKCKGFALVTMSDTDLARRLVEEWPWRRNQRTKEVGVEDDITREATKFGFRVLPKARWDQLKEEYLARRAKLVEQISSQASQHTAGQHENEDGEGEEYEDEEAPAPQPVAAKRKRSLTPVPDVPSANITTIYSPYPYNCLVFVKNIHPETNKTTLRTLFASAFDKAQVGNGGDGLDYVDFTKGMNSCYLRLATPEHTTHLLSYFSQTPTTQTHGLDNAGSTDSQKNKPIVMELVDGTREELYWGKVPEKVRRQAVEKAVRGSGITKGENVEGGQAQKKRRR
ncbi:hypothetical protein BXZ70DRAFT_898273 [Cristinia sonorae]|uniref:XRRM domain-containing protein n=1 Tax=Cristinia sonorae TaxID=1940300 RepID=A0A8K0UII9_9AGAR|nr:hypothetical protein BXZ70DRAFT_898273 [Cristinia sonorae]